MAATDSMDLVALVRAHLEQASPDALRALVKTFAEAVMSAEAQVRCNAEYGEVDADRINSRNGYRPRTWDTRAGTIDLAVPKLRHGSYFPDWLLGRRRRAELALTTVVATSYLDAARREALRGDGDHRALKEPGLRDGKEPRRGGRGVQEPTA